VVQFSQEQKKDAVIELCAREGSAAAVADKLGVSRISLYKWKKELLGEDDATTIVNATLKLGQMPGKK
jgi:transposase-like protein